MPTYTYYCDSCNKKFEMFFYIKDYKPSPVCTYCSATTTNRSYIDDVGSVNGSVIKHDSELKTVGDLANRNRDRLSNDQKNELYQKHNSYKDLDNKPLPQGMNRIKKSPKRKWTS
jgi:putative FmdB family regulatory protein